jgi:hypothetical protein
MPTVEIRAVGKSSIQAVGEKIWEGIKCGYEKGREAGEWLGRKVCLITNMAFEGLPFIGLRVFTPLWVSAVAASLIGIISTFPTQNELQRRNIKVLVDSFSNGFGLGCLAMGCISVLEGTVPWGVFNIALGVWSLSKGNPFKEPDQNVPCPPSPARDRVPDAALLV